MARPKGRKVIEEICGAPGAFGPCKMPAGAGTKHRGEGPCYHHEEDLAQISNKVTASAAKDWIQTRLSELQWAPELIDLKKEIATAKAILEALVGGILTIGDSSNTLFYQNLLLGTVGRLVERMHRIEVEKKGLVPLLTVKRILMAVGDASEAIPDMNDRARFLNEYRKLVRPHLVQLSAPVTESDKPLLERK
jgi:hypothetical protein